jgi:hypothetical protein
MLGRNCIPVDCTIIVALDYEQSDGVTTIPEGIVLATLVILLAHCAVYQVLGLVVQQPVPACSPAITETEKEENKT